MDTYVAWLKKENLPLFEAGGIWWEPYQRTLMPASVKPEPVQISTWQAKELLERSGALLLRYFTRTFKEPTDFWYGACDEYKFDKLSSKTRTGIRGGRKNCAIQRVDPAWIAINGYECHVAAFKRYSNASPESQEEFTKRFMAFVGGPFDFWAAFCGGKLAAYSKCNVADNHVASVVAKVHPAYLRFRPIDALTDAMLTTYVAGEHKQVTYGFRSIAHATNVQEYLEKFGFHKIYCDLQVVYRPSVRALVSFLMPFKPVLASFPDTNLTSRLRSILTQEEIRRSFL
jgi:hypothetical protein